MKRLLCSNRERSAKRTRTGERTTRIDLRTAIIGLGAVAAGYVLGRRLWSGEAPSTDELRERAGEALPGEAVEVPIGETDETGEADGEEAMAGTDPTLEEIDERTEEDVEETPAEPGEMHVDEDVVDEAVDEDLEEDTGQEDVGAEDIAEEVLDEDESENEE